MEYNKMIELARQAPHDAPDTGEVMESVRHGLRVRRQRQRLLTSMACIVLAVTPIALTTHLSNHTSRTAPTLAETVSATLSTTPNDLPAPLRGYRNSIRNHQIMTVI